jgi:hypothetical protein
MKPIHFLLILSVTMSTNASCAEASTPVQLGIFNDVRIEDVVNENSNVLYQTQNGTTELAAEKVRSTFTIRNNGPQTAFLKGLRIEELNRTYQPFAGLDPVVPAFEKAVVIESTKLYMDIPISYEIQPNEVGQFALVFSSNVQGGNLEIWIKVTLIYDKGSEVSEILHLSIRNYGYIIKADPGNGWLITPGR